MDRTLLAERNVGIGLGKWGSLRDGAGRGSRVEKGGALEVHLYEPQRYQPLK